MTTPDAPAAGPTLHLTIELGTPDARHTKEQTPAVRYTATHGGPSGTIRMDEAEPHIDAPDGSFALVEAEMILSRVLDEQAWLAEIHRLLRPGGVLRATLPAAGALAWLDAHNIYRYVVDITGRGRAPTATLPTGWNRHYFEDELRRMVEDAGFQVERIERTGMGLAEVPHLAGLVVGDFLLHHPRIEHVLHPRRRKLERVDRDVRLPGLGKILTLTAVRP
mgnify:CR=1 FL=1